MSATLTRRGAAGLLAAGALLPAARAGAAESLRLGVLRLASSGPVFLAGESGYFRDAGLTAELRFFEAAQPVAVAAVAGDVDVGITGLTAGFYNLAGKGALKIIAAQSREEPGFRLVALVASRKGREAGVTTAADLPGRSVGVTQVGSTFHYSLGLLAQKAGFGIGQTRVVPLQSIPNLVAAVKGAQVDAAMMPATAAAPLLASGEATLIAWADETPWQVAAVFTTPRVIERRRPALEAFVAGYRRGARAFHDAFLNRGADGQVRPGPGAEAALATIATAIGGSVESVRAAIPYVDPEARLLVGDIGRQVAWYKEQRLVDPGVDAAAIVDLSFVPGHLDVPT